MSWVLAGLGFAVLIVLHELGHFAAAKAVGMRVERFALFFPPLLLRKKIGETEYALGAIPAGGYVKISGMNPSEELPEEVRDRAYHAQPVWKRIVVIFAGPAVNLVVGFVLLVAYAFFIGPAAGNEVGAVSKGFPAQDVLHVEDELVAIDGHRESPRKLSDRVAANKCPQKPLTDRCKAARPMKVTVRRDGRERTFTMTPVYDAKADPPKMRLGFAYNPRGGAHNPLPFGESVDGAARTFVRISEVQLTIPARILDSEQRREIHGIVGNYEVTRQTILEEPSDVVFILAVISLALAIVNLFPFLPLDGGHIFWALVEKVRRKPVALATMEKSGIIGFGLVIILFVIGLSNDVRVLNDGGFKVP